jgi:hypothetical protein
MALVVLVPVDAPDAPEDGVEFFQDGHMSAPSIVIVDHEESSGYVSALSAVIIASGVTCEAVDRIMTFAADLSVEMPGVSCEYTPWYCGVPFRRL